MQTTTRISNRSRKRLVASVSLALLLCLCAVQFGRIEQSESVAHAGAVTENTASQPPPHEYIDGAANPDNIPDHVAYGLVFRLISGGQTVAEQHSLRAYINQLGLGSQKCLTASKGKEQPEVETEIEAMVAAADEYNRKVGILDQQAKAIRDASQGELTADAVGALAALQKQKEAMVTATVVALEQKLGPEGAGRLRQSINQRVKRQIKIKRKLKDSGQHS
jgi:hypothetical protein